MCIPQKGNSGVSLNDTNFRLLDLRKGGGDQSSRQLQQIFIRFQGLDIEQCKNNYNEFDSISLKGVIGMHAIFLLHVALLYLYIRPDMSTGIH